MRTALPGSARCQALWRLPSLSVATHFSPLSFTAPRRLPKPSSRHLPVIAAAMTTQAAPPGPQDTIIEETVERIHSSPFKLVMYVTGGASQVSNRAFSYQYSLSIKLNHRSISIFFFKVYHCLFVSLQTPHPTSCKPLLLSL